MPNNQQINLEESEDSTEEDPKVKQCPWCGTKNPGCNKYCQKCGRPLDYPD